MKWAGLPVIGSLKTSLNIRCNERNGRKPAENTERQTVEKPGSKVERDMG